jgi:transposase InsO family protein
MKYIDHDRHRFGVESICRALEISSSTYHAKKRRPPSARAVKDEALWHEIERIRTPGNFAYGARKTWKQLGRENLPAARCTVERVMRERGACGKSPGWKKKFTTVADPGADRPADHVERNFTASRPNQLWVSDMTYIKTREGFLYFAFVKDVFSRKIVGWQTANHMRTDLPLEALEMAVALRMPDPKAGLIAHSDQGSQYTSYAYTQRLVDCGIEPSVGTVADAYDNAMAEAFVGTLKTECVDGKIYRSRFDAELAIAIFIGWFNSGRLHENLDDVPPDEFEENYRLESALTEEIKYTTKGRC